MLEQINLTQLTDHLDTDDWKLIAFHLGQTFSLIQGTELYTKKEIAQKFVNLQKFLYREQEKYTARDLIALEQLKSDIVSEFNDFSVIVKKDNLNMMIADEEGLVIRAFSTQF